MKKIMIICAALLACLSCTSIDMASRYPNMIADMDPLLIGTIEVSFDQVFTSRVKLNDEVKVIFYPRENTVALEFRHELVTYRQFWNLAARQRFIDALKLYKDDFDARRLVFKYNKSRAAYGKIQGKVEWETFKFTSTYKSSPLLELGYRFKGESPYFTVLQRSAKEETGAMSGSQLESKQIPMYYTKAHGERLAEFFNQDFLHRIVGYSDEQSFQDMNETQGDVY